MPLLLSKHRLILLAILLLATGLRAWNLAGESFWLDELSVMSVAKGSWAALHEHLSTKDVHPPLFFVLIKLWGGLFGFGESAARSLSVVAGVAAVGFAYLLGRRLASERAGLAAAALLACSPFAVYYAREARGYSLLLALSLAATWLLVRAAPEFRARRLVPYVLLATALAYTHVFGPFTLAAHLAYVVALVAGRRVAPGAGRRLAAAGAAVVLLHLPWVPVTLAQIGRVERGFWIPRPDPGLWLREWRGEGAAAVAWVVLTVVAAVIALWRVGRRDRPAAVLLAAGVLLPSLVPIGLSLVTEPIFMAKYAIAATGLLLVTAALALAAPRRAVAAAAIAVLCVAGVAETVRDTHLTRHKEQWRELAAFTSRESIERGVPLVLTVRYRRHLSNYLDPRATLWSVGRAELESCGPDGLAARLAAHGSDRFWLLNVHPARTNPELEPLFRARWTPVERRAWYQAEAVLWVDAGSIAGQDRAQGGTP